MKTYEQILEELKQSPNPGDLSEMLQWLSAEYGFCATQMEAIQIKKPDTWLELKKTSKSDAETDRKWELSEDGRNEIGYRWRLKGIEKVMSAIKTRIRVLEGESRNQY
jgi:tagatose-1,6-bisphosphate aldolase non-catalytic subunit AgaZ/GatZ